MVNRIHRRRHHRWTLPLLLVYLFGPQWVVCSGPVEAPAGPNLFGVDHGCSGCSSNTNNKVETYGRIKTPSPAPSENPFLFLNSAQFGRSPAPSPTPYPTSSLPYTPASTSSSAWESTSNANFLIAAFFLIAAGWLFVAFLYAVLVLVVIRLRRRGPMDIHDEYFGRIYLYGSPTSTRQCYIPLGWLLRRYVTALNDRSVVANRMSRAERRASLEVLFEDTAALKDKHHKSLLKRKAVPNSGQVDAKEFEREGSQSSLPVECGIANVEDQAIPVEENEQPVDLEGQAGSSDAEELMSNAEPVCSICLGEYDGTETVFDSPTCPHRFHKECILDWLERRDNTECPCCRGDIIDEEEIWKTVTRLRRQRRNQSRRQVFMHRLRQFVPFVGNGHDNPDESMETENTAEDETESNLEGIPRSHPLPPPPPQMNHRITPEVQPQQLLSSDSAIPSSTPSSTIVNETTLPMSPSLSLEEDSEMASEIPPISNLAGSLHHTTPPLVSTHPSSLGGTPSLSFEDVYLTSEEQQSSANGGCLDADVPTSSIEQPSRTHLEL